MNSQESSTGFSGGTLSESCQMSLTAQVFSLLSVGPHLFMMLIRG